MRHSPRKLKVNIVSALLIASTLYRMTEQLTLGSLVNVSQVQKAHTAVQSLELLICTST